MSHTRTALLDAAREAVLSTGWARARMADVAAAAGVSRQTLYAEFGSKDGLASALAVREAERFVEGALAARAGHEGSPAEAVAASTEWTLRAAAEDPLLKAVLTDDGTDGLLPWLTTRADLLREVVRERNRDHLREHWPALAPEDVAPVEDLLFRLTVSHIVSPGEAPEVVARRLGDLVARLLPTPGGTP